MRKFVISENVLALIIHHFDTQEHGKVKHIEAAIQQDAVEYEAYKANEAAQQENIEKQNAELKEIARKKIIDEYEREKLINQFNELGLVGDANELDNECLKECIKTHIEVMKREENAK